MGRDECKLACICIFLIKSNKMTQVGHTFYNKSFSGLRSGFRDLQCKITWFYRIFLKITWFGILTSYNTSAIRMQKRPQL